MLVPVGLSNRRQKTIEAPTRIDLLLLETLPATGEPPNLCIQRVCTLALKQSIERRLAPQAERVHIT